MHIQTLCLAVVLGGVASTPLFAGTLRRTRVLRRVARSIAPAQPLALPFFRRGPLSIQWVTWVMGSVPTARLPGVDCASFGSAPGFYAIIEQSLATTPGQLYTLSFGWTRISTIRAPTSRFTGRRLFATRRCENVTGPLPDLPVGPAILLPSRLCGIESVHKPTGLVRGQPRASRASVTAV